MVHDALDVLEHAKATPAAHRRLRQMRSDCLGGCLKSAQQLLKAHALFVEMADDDGDNDARLPAASLCASLVEGLAMRGHAALAEKVLAAMADDEMALSAKLCCQVLMALLRAGLASKAFGVFERHLERAGGAESLVPSLRAPDGYNVEHALALLTKALSKQVDGAGSEVVVQLRTGRSIPQAAGWREPSSAARGPLYLWPCSLHHTRVSPAALLTLLSPPRSTAAARTASTRRRRAPASPRTTAASASPRSRSRASSRCFYPSLDTR